MNPLSQKQLFDYEKDGYLILPSVLAPSDIAEIHKEILEHLNDVEARFVEDEAYQKIRMYRRFAVGLHIKKEKIRTFVSSPIFKEIGKAFIGNEVDLFGTSTIVKSEGRNRSIDWHQDLAYDKGQDLSRIICWTSITESHPENGGLFIFPGSHKLGLQPHEKSELYERDVQTIGVDEKKALPLHLEKGQIIVLHPLVIHGSSENRTNSDRVALMSMYQKPKFYSEQEMKIKMEILRENEQAA